MAQETMPGVGSAVEIEDDFGVVDFDIGDDHARTGLGGEPLADDHVQIVDTGGLELAVGRERQALVAAGKGAHGKALFRLERTEQIDAGLGIERGFAQLDMRGLDLRVAAVHRAGDGHAAFAVGVDGENLGGADASTKPSRQRTCAGEARETPADAVVRDRCRSRANALGKETPLHGNLPWFRTLIGKP